MIERQRDVQRMRERRRDSHLVMQKNAIEEKDKMKTDKFSATLKEQRKEVMQ